MEQSPSGEATKSSASQEIIRILYNPGVHCHTRKSLPSFLILSQINPIHTSPSNFLKIHFNIILQIMFRSSQWFFPSEPCVLLSCPPYLPHTPPISYFLIWSPEYSPVGEIKSHSAQTHAFVLLHVDCHVDAVQKHLILTYI